MLSKTEQLTLPIDVRPRQDVRWYNVEEIARRGFLGKKVIHHALLFDMTGNVQSTKIAVDDIDKLHDPDLRYALRFAAAADAMGWIPEGSLSAYSNSVTVEATGCNNRARLVSASYTGVAEDTVDTFMEDINSFRTPNDENN